MDNNKKIRYRTERQFGNEKIDFYNNSKPDMTELGTTTLRQVLEGYTAFYIKNFNKNLPQNI